MPAPEVSNRHQTAVLWEVDGYDSHAEVTVGAPAAISVRWNNTQGRALDPQGNTVALDATVIVAQDVPVGSLMWLGTLAQLEAVGNTLTNLMQARTVEKTPDLKGRVHFRQLGLVKYRDVGLSDLLVWNTTVSEWDALATTWN